MLRPHNRLCIGGYEEDIIHATIQRRRWVACSRRTDGVCGVSAGRATGLRPATDALLSAGTSKWRKSICGPLGSTQGQLWASLRPRPRSQYGLTRPAMACPSVASWIARPGVSCSQDSIKCAALALDGGTTILSSPESPHQSRPRRS